MADEPAVDENFGVAEHAVEFQPDPFAGVLRRQIKRAAIPGDVVGGETGADGSETVSAIGALDRRAVRPPNRAAG